MPDSAEHIGKYRIIGEVARGGMGAVYTAKHPTLGRTVIIKKLTIRGNADVRERFRREAQIMMDLRNDAVVDVYDHFREGANYYIVLEYVDGVSLQELLQTRGALPEAAGLLIVREVCRALSYAHQRGVVHRDIKPANILISHEGEVKLVDFGIAAVHDQFANGEDATQLTRVDATLGTPSYMAPEQFENTQAVDHRADIYAVGVVLYEALTGSLPFGASFSPELLLRVQKGRYKRPRRVNGQVSHFSQRLIRRLMRVRPGRRFQELAPVITRVNRRLRLRPHDRTEGLLKPFMQGGAVPKARPGGRFSRVRRWTAGRAGVVLSTVLCLAVVATGGVGAVRHGYHNELFRPGSYGVLAVEIDLPGSGRPVEELRPIGRVFLDDGAGIPEVGGGMLSFRVSAGENDRYVFRSERRRLEAGSYRLKLEYGNLVYWRSFLLPAARELSSSRIVVPGRSEHAMVLRHKVSSLPTVSLVPQFAVYDEATGEPLSDTAGVYLLEGTTRHELRPGSGGLPLELSTGSIHRFELSHAGYEPQVFSLAIRPEQSSLLIEAGLQRTSEP